MIDWLVRGVAGEARPTADMIAMALAAVALLVVAATLARVVVALAIAEVPREPRDRAGEETD